MTTQNYAQPLKALEMLKVKNATDNTNTNKSTSLIRRYEQLFRTERHADVTFRVENAIVKCHKLILSTASPVFEAMFYGPLREAEGDIQILDISPEMFKILINYIYTSTVNYDQLSLEETIELYYGAEKYMLTEFIAECLTSITRKLRFSNILPALDLSVCMNLSPLLELCMAFFTRCCLSDPQYATYLKANYVHVSEKCIKAIIAENKARQKKYPWFIYMWYQHQYDELGLQQREQMYLRNDLELENDDFEYAELFDEGRPCRTIERCYYKASRPFVIDSDTREWQLILRSDRFISLHGFVLHSRLTPMIVNSSSSCAEYNESLTIEISTLIDNSDGDESDDHAEAQDQEQFIWRHSINNQPTKFNCNLNINWKDKLTISPDKAYKIRFIWPERAYGAEYPCSLLSNVVDGIQFQDRDLYNGSLVKGLRLINLV